MTEPTAELETQKTELLKIELMQTDVDNDYMLYSKTEILSILRTLISRASLITVYFNHGNDFLMTSLLAIEPNGEYMLLDIGGNQEMNQRALQADKLICITSLDKIKIQFVLRTLQSKQFEERSAFRTEVPKALMRLQRREFFRLLLPVTRPLKCQLPLLKKDNTKTVFEASILDISGGGIGIQAPSDDIRFDTDMLLEDAQIELPGIGNITVMLRVRSMYEVILLNGTRSRRAGCQFISPSGQALTLIQRFIIKAERDRKAHDTGLG